MSPSEFLARSCDGEKLMDAYFVQLVQGQQIEKNKNSRKPFARRTVLTPLYFQNQLKSVVVQCPVNVRENFGENKHSCIEKKLFIVFRFLELSYCLFSERLFYNFNNEANCDYIK